MEFENYILFYDFSHLEEQPSPPSDQEIQTLEFDDSYAIVGFGVGVVLFSLDGDITQIAYNLKFKNTNNTIEYEGLQLGITVAK